ncbi:MAG: hypothetical protein KAT34_16775 [Candidatus Aminicenantes bacterium]|nr:hypothetical protein [Candidatus Aminicenantes bacterium]
MGRKAGPLSLKTVETQHLASQLAAGLDESRTYYDLFPDLPLGNEMIVFSYKIRVN